MVQDNPEDLLTELMLETIKELRRKIKDGTASPADLSVARALLRDNNITASSKPGQPLSGLVYELETIPEEQAIPSR